MGPVSNYRLSFRIFHPTAPAEDIAKTIGLRSKVLHSVGAPRMTPKGKRLDGVYHRTYVLFDLTEYESEELEDALRRVMNEKLMSKAPVLNELIATGGKAEFFIGIFLDGNEGLTIDRALMSSLASAGIGFGLDLYGQDPDHSECPAGADVITPPA